MTDIRDFTDLVAWQKAHQLMLDMYEFVKLLPTDERFNRVSQLRRSASSTPSNIAEGYGRFHYKENVRFCRQARGSVSETKNHLIAARDLKQAPAETCEKLIGLCDDVFRLLSAYITATQKRAVEQQRAPQ